MSACHAVLHSGRVQVDVRQLEADVPRSDVTAETLQVATETRCHLHGNGLCEVLLRRAAQRNLRKILVIIYSICNFNSFQLKVFIAFKKQNTNTY